MSTFTDQKPFVVDADRRSAFTRLKKKFNCSICGKEFEIGDTARWVYANGTNGFHGGNFFVCEADNTPNVLDRAKESFETARKLAKQWGIYGPEWQ